MIEKAWVLGPVMLSAMVTNRFWSIGVAFSPSINKREWWLIELNLLCLHLTIEGRAKNYE